MKQFDHRIKSNYNRRNKKIEKRGRGHNLQGLQSTKRTKELEHQKARKPMSVSATTSTITTTAAAVAAAAFPQHVLSLLHNSLSQV